MVHRVLQRAHRGRQPGAAGAAPPFRTQYRRGACGRPREGDRPATAGLLQGGVAEGHSP